jgi:uncharacterized membrane protein YfcA
MVAESFRSTPLNAELVIRAPAAMRGACLGLMSCTGAIGGALGMIAASMVIKGLPTFYKGTANHFIVGYKISVAIGILVWLGSIVLTYLDNRRNTVVVAPAVPQFSEMEKRAHIS